MNGLLRSFGDFEGERINCGRIIRKSNLNKFCADSNLLLQK